jgi:hypothetical protein
VLTQTVRHRDFFVPVSPEGQILDEDQDATPPSNRTALTSLALLLVALIAGDTPDRPARAHDGRERPHRRAGTCDVTAGKPASGHPGRLCRLGDAALISTFNAVTPRAPKVAHWNGMPDRPPKELRWST